MKCLYCNKLIIDSASEEEKKWCWHKSCVNKFFSTTKMPNLDLSSEMIKKIADESTNKGYTITGVQKKLPLHLSKEGKEAKLTLVNYPCGFILKPQTEDFDQLPEYEYLAMKIAQECGVDTVQFALVKINDEFAYITKRIDRINIMDDTKKLAMEDFCQLDEKLTEDKYKGSYEKCVDIIKRFSSNKVYDISELVLRLVVSFVIGNSDMHLKNFSLIETGFGTKKHVLSKAYDILPVNCILLEDKEQFALSMFGKKNNIRKKTFFEFAKSIKLDYKIIEKIILRVINKEEKILSLCRESYLNDVNKEKIINLISSRIKTLRE